MSSPAECTGRQTGILSLSQTGKHFSIIHTQLSISVANESYEPINLSQNGLEKESHSQQIQCTRPYNMHVSVTSF